MEYARFNSIIGIVVWYQPSEKEVEALRLYSGDLPHVIIVDNSETDNSALCASVPHCTYLFCGGNRGIATALNIGCKEAVRRGARWVLTMDQDSRWDQQSVADYIREAAQYEDFERVGIFSPYHDTDGMPEKHKRIGRFEVMERVMCSGNLLRIEAWQEAQGFRDDFFIDRVDDEMDCHLRQLGWRVVRVNTMMLTHPLGNSLRFVKWIGHPYSAHPAWRYYYCGRNMLRLAQLYPEEAHYYRAHVVKELKRLLFYDKDDQLHKLREFMRGVREGRRPYPQTIQLTLSPRYEDMRVWLTEVINTFETQGKVLYRGRNEIRTVQAPDGNEWTIKRFHAPRGIQRIIYSFFRVPKAERAYHNALEMTKAGLPTPEAIGFARNEGRWLNENYLITRRSALTRDFYEFRYHDAAGYENIIQAFARLIADMHQKGFYHLDLSPGNILFEEQADGKVAFAIIDINRMRTGRSVSQKEACRNFCRLWGRMDFIEMLSDAYADARGWDKEVVKGLVTYYWKRFWHIRSAQDIERIFDRTIRR